MFYNCCGLKSKNLTCYSTVLDYIAHLSFINGWRARGIINIARDAAELADEMNDKMIEIRHIDEIAEIAPQKELKEIIKKLDPPALNILLFLLQRNGKGIEEDALDWFKEKSGDEGIASGRSRTTFYNALSRLKGMELVDSEIKGRGRGKGRYAILRINNRQFQLVKEAIIEFFEENKKYKR
jgi:Cdc6-like AAA superfamily ATPase